MVGFVIDPGIVSGVERGDDLRELIMRPVDTDAINAEIQRLRGRKDELEAAETEIDEADADLEESRRKESVFQDALEDLRDARGDLEDVGSNSRRSGRPLLNSVRSASRWPRSWRSLRMPRWVSRGPRSGAQSSFEVSVKR